LAYEFLAPTLLRSESEQTLFVHSKHHWDLIQIGYGQSNQVRFTFNKKRVELFEFVSSDCKQTITIQHEIPPNYEIVKKFESEHWKGVELKLKEMRSEVAEFQMS
jgi:hypothetical protein